MLTTVKKQLLIFGFVGFALVFVLNQLQEFSSETSLDDWAQGFEGYLQASRLQARTNKPMAVFFYTDWCPNCKKLRETILSSAPVKDYMGNFLAVKVNPELSNAANKLSDAYNVRGYPAFFIVNETSGALVRITRTANVTPQQFVEQLERAYQKVAG